jgi:hypothetical protein
MLIRLIFGALCSDSFYAWYMQMYGQGTSFLYTGLFPG